MLDGDYAGRSATIRIRNALEPYTNVQCITLPLDLDPDDLTDNDLLSLIKQIERTFAAKSSG